MSPTTKVALATLLFASVLLGGFIAATGTSGTAAESDAGRATVVNVVRTLVTVRERDEVVTRPVRVVRRTVMRGVTSLQTDVRYDTFTTPGETRVLAYARTTTLPGRTISGVVTRDGRAVTVERTLPGQTVARTITSERVVTNERTLERIVTDERLVTVPQTVRVTDSRTITDSRTVTDLRTVTVASTATTTLTDAVTVTLPPETATVTVTRTRGVGGG